MTDIVNTPVNLELIYIKKKEKYIYKSDIGTLAL